jgi:hypothetical protein
MQRRCSIIMFLPDSADKYIGWRLNAPFSFLPHRTVVLSRDTPISRPRPAVPNSERTRRTFQHSIINARAYNVLLGSWQWAGMIDMFLLAPFFDSLEKIVGRFWFRQFSK